MALITGGFDGGTPGGSEGGLKSVQYGGLINEEVMQQIWDISKIPLPLQDMISSDGAGNEHCEWTVDELAAPDLTNAVHDGHQITTEDDSAVGDRVGNHCQNSIKVVNVSTRARNSNVVGMSDALSYQVIRRQQELHRDVEAISLSSQASVADKVGTGAAIGKAGGLGSWIATATANVTGAGGFSLTTGLTVAPTATKAALTEDNVRDVCETVYQNGGNPSVFMSGTSVIRRFSEYLFTSSARVATLMSDQGKSREAAAALGSVNVFVTDFGVTLELHANRLQQADAIVGDGTAYNGYIIDPEYLRMAFLTGYRVEPLAKNGLSDRRLMVVDWTLKVLNEKAHGMIAAIDPAVAMTA
jgi:hypothetical protein